MKRYRYSEWDGTQDLFELDQDALMDELEQHLMRFGDLSYALWKLQRGGISGSDGRRLSSLQELIDRLRQRKQRQLDKYKLSSVVDEIGHQLDDIIQTERDGIRRRLGEARQRAAGGAQDLSPDMVQNLLQVMQDNAAQNLSQLDNLPADIGGRIRELSQYDFMDEEARRQFQELMDMLKRQVLESYARDLGQSIKDLDAAAMASIRHLVEAINQMLEQRQRGEEPDFESFMAQFGHHFGPNPPQSLDELIQQLRQGITQMQSLLNSLPPAERQSLQDLVDSVFDPGTQYEMAKLADNLGMLFPQDRSPRGYPLSGEEPISYTQALRLMETLQKMDQLESQLKDSQYRRSLEDIDRQLVEELMGADAAEELDRISQIAQVLEEAGYIRRQDGGYELTPRGMRRIGQKALRDIFAQLRKDRSGGHDIKRSGNGGERTDDTKRYEFGDDFQLDLGQTIFNSLYRQPATPPLQLNVDDFEVFTTKQSTRSATVLLLDLSLSMPMRGNFEAAKRVAVALDELIHSRYPQDSLHVVGFSSYARQLKMARLPYLGWDEFDPYTNIQHGLFLARKLLTKERCRNQQIILISDGEPTAHFEGQHIFFQYPPSQRTIQSTMEEVKQCTQGGIVINTFMLEGGGFPSAFVTRMARINKGRVFFTDSRNLGQYLLVDYISGKKHSIK